MAISWAVNVLLLISAVSIPAAISYNTENNLPDLAALLIIFFISLVIFRLLGVPSLVNALEAGTPEAIFEREKLLDKISTDADARRVARESERSSTPSTPPSSASRSAADSGVEDDGELTRCDSQEFPLSATDSAVVDCNDPYISQFPALETEFLAFADLEASPSSPPGTPGAIWHTVLKQSWGAFSIEIHKRADSDFFFRYVMQLEATPEEAFDLLADIKERSAWDELCEDVEVIERVSDRTTIQSFRTKGIWPTKSRAALVVSFTKRLAPSRYLNVTKSIDSHPAFIPHEGDVRMIANIAGQIVEADPEGRPRMCRVVQVVDGDLGGWLPKSIVAMVTTSAIPVGMRKANSMLKKILEQKTVSKLIAAAEGEVEEEEKNKGEPTKVGGARLVGAKTRLSPPISKQAAVVADTTGNPATAARMAAPAPPSVAAAAAAPASSSSSHSVLRRTDSILNVRPNVAKFIFDILKRSQPWVVVSVLLAIISGRFKR
ncbi:hypothetical protein HDU87_006432 [Geranomyces variabilis]|uniref:START domain-containing protein n=1 Tax=Geranomyces variabilis TaxID=109894 RepID=A0AAD5TFH2_9FUNG|nr:hypothetical protein HDU87_006432 [Geranomyces variabilis]